MCFKVFYNTLFGGLEPKLYSITNLRTVLYGEIIRVVDNVQYDTDFMYNIGY